MCQYEKRKCRYRKHTLIFNGKLLDNHAPLKTIRTVDRPMINWVTGDIISLKLKKNNIK